METNLSMVGEGTLPVLPSHENKKRQEVVDRGAIIPPAIDSAAKGGLVARRRFQRGSVFLNRTRSLWLGQFAEYVLDSNGTERRIRRQIILAPVHGASGQVRKREAQRLLQPYLDRVNASLSAPVREHKHATFEVFARVWERDYLRLSKPSTQATMRGQLKRLVAYFGQKDMRHIGAADLQRLIATMTAEGLQPKTIRNLWGTVRLIWEAALAQGFVDRVLPKPKLPRAVKKTPRHFTLEDVARILSSAPESCCTFYWLAAETGLRAGELCALSLADLRSDRLTVRQSVWHGRVTAPKTSNAVRTVALSPRLACLVSEQAGRQKRKGHRFLFSTASGKPWDSSLLVKRKLRPLLRTLEVENGGLHAFRHFNASLLGSLCVPLKTIQERLGHASLGSLTLDCYTHATWEQNVEAARLAGEAIGNAVDSDSLTACTEKRLPTLESEALAAN